MTMEEKWGARPPPGVQALEAGNSASGYRGEQFKVSVGLKGTIHAEQPPLSSFFHQRPLVSLCLPGLWDPSSLPSSLPRSFTKFTSSQRPPSLLCSFNVPG